LVRVVGISTEDGGLRCAGSLVLFGRLDSQIHTGLAAVSKGDQFMMTRREINTALGAVVATVLSRTIASLRAESPAPQQGSPEAAPANSPRGIATLMQQSIGDPGDCEGRILVLTIPPKLVSSPHRHPGPVFAYILEGQIENQVDPDPPKTYSAGDVFYEPTMHVHRSLRNLSDTQTARVLVFQLVPKGQPGGLPAK
jgi:quercetin dioxygenase-like cupin family protein